MPKYIFYFLLLPLFLDAEENFILINSRGETLIEWGVHVDERRSPCSTFKIALSLMGFDAAILQDEQTPLWAFQKGYDDELASWRAAQTPQTWMKNSCIWYSRLLAAQLGSIRFSAYLAALNYGNQDASGGHTSAWLSSSLQISPREQTAFIQKMVQGELPVCPYSVQMTKQITFIEELGDGWRLFGKTGGSGIINGVQLGWFVGWVEKGTEYFCFAYNIQDTTIDFNQRIPRAKQLLSESGICN